MIKLAHAPAACIAGAGIAAGLGAAVVLSRVLAGLLFGIEPPDPGTFAAVTAAFILLIVIAAWIPSRRATRVAPIVALRTE